MTGLETIGLIAGGLGTALEAGGTILGANSSAAALEAQRPYDMLSAAYRAQSLKYAADESRAASQRQAFALGQQKDQALSRARAVAAASGAGATDTTVGNIEAGLENQGEFQKAMAIFAGENRARGLEDESRNALIAGVNRSSVNQYQADTLRSNAPLQAAGTILSGASTVASRYGRRIPNSVNYG